MCQTSTNPTVLNAPARAKVLQFKLANVTALVSEMHCKLHDPFCQVRIVMNGWCRFLSFLVEFYERRLYVSLWGRLVCRRSTAQLLIQRRIGLRAKKSSSSTLAPLRGRTPVIWALQVIKIVCYFQIQMQEWSMLSVCLRVLRCNTFTT